MKRVLVIEGNPSGESFGAALARSYAEGAAGAGAEVEALRLGELEFDPILRRGFSGEQALEPDLIAAREAIERADHVAIEFPVWWGSLPALLKGFIDRTFLPGWAFSHEPGRGGLPEGLLAGRSARVLATMDSPSWWYAFKHRRAAHRALTHATLAYCGVTSVRETTVYGLRTLDERARAGWIARARELGARDAR